MKLGTVTRQGPGFYKYNGTHTWIICKNDMLGAWVAYRDDDPLYVLDPLPTKADVIAVLRTID